MWPRAGAGRGEMARVAGRVAARSGGLRGGGGVVAAGRRGAARGRPASGQKWAAFAEVAELWPRPEVGSLRGGGGVVAAGVAGAARSGRPSRRWSSCGRAPARGGASWRAWRGELRPEGSGLRGGGGVVAARRRARAPREWPRQNWAAFAEVVELWPRAVAGAARSGQPSRRWWSCGRGASRGVARAPRERPEVGSLRGGGGVVAAARSGQPSRRWWSCGRGRRGGGQKWAAFAEVVELWPRGGARAARGRPEVGSLRGGGGVVAAGRRGGGQKWAAFAEVVELWPRGGARAARGRPEGGSLRGGGGVVAARRRGGGQKWAAFAEVVELWPRAGA